MPRADGRRCQFRSLHSNHHTSGGLGGGSSTMVPTAAWMKHFISWHPVDVIPNKQKMDLVLYLFTLVNKCLRESRDYFILSVNRTGKSKFTQMWKGTFPNSVLLCNKYQHQNYIRVRMIFQSQLNSDFAEKNPGCFTESYFWKLLVPLKETLSRLFALCNSPKVTAEIDNFT